MVRNSNNHLNHKDNLPYLRFSDFNDSWENQKIGDFICERNEVANTSLPLYSLTIENGVVPKTERYERSYLVNRKDEAYKVMKPKDFAYNPMNLRFGALAMFKGNMEIAVSKYYNVFFCRDICDPFFLESYLTSYKMIQFYNRMSTGSLEEKKRVHYLDFIKFRKPFPSYQEQQKIASFLSVVDKKIELLTRKKELLEQYKKGVMQKIFSQEIRFRDEDGKDFPDWEETRLGNVTQLFSRRNKNLIDAPIYSVTNYDGFVLQGKHFSREVAGNDLKSYKIIRKDEFAYNPARINVGSIAFFSQEIGIISSLYVCFRTKPKLNNKFLWYFLQLAKTKHDINTYGEGGVRIYLWYPLIASIIINLPSIQEQEHIAAFLSKIDNKIEHIQKQIYSTKMFKKGLLQQMFV